MRHAALLAVVACLAFAGTANALLPPMFLAANQAQACLNPDPQVNATVVDLSQTTTSGGYDAGLTVRVNACGATCLSKAQAIATLMAPWAKTNKVSVVVVLGNGPTAPLQPGKMPKGDAAADLVASALTGNPVYRRLSKVGGTPPPAGMVGGDGSNLNAQPVVEFAPVVVQYSSGDISDIYGQSNKVARDACAEVFGVSTTVAPGGRAPASSSTGLISATAKMSA